MSLVSQGLVSQGLVSQGNKVRRAVNIGFRNNMNISSCRECPQLFNAKNPVILSIKITEI